MGLLATAQKIEKVYGPTLDGWRGVVPLALLLWWWAHESGGDRLCVSKDRHLIECGFAQVPLARAFALSCDPFNSFGACWIACAEALSDVRYWQATDADDPLRRAIGRWIAVPDRNLFWTVEEDYSIGTGR